MSHLFLLATIFGMASIGLHTGARAETWYGLILTAKGGGLSTEIVPFESEEQCEAASFKLEGDKRLYAHIKGITVSCFKGK